MKSSDVARRGYRAKQQLSGVGHTPSASSSSSGSSNQSVIGPSLLSEALVSLGGQASAPEITEWLAEHRPAVLAHFGGDKKSVRYSVVGILSSRLYASLFAKEKVGHNNSSSGSKDSQWRLRHLAITDAHSNNDNEGGDGSSSSRNRSNSNRNSSSGSSSGSSSSKTAVATYRAATVARGEGGDRRPGPSMDRPGKKAQFLEANGLFSLSEVAYHESSIVAAASVTTAMEVADVPVIVNFYSFSSLVRCFLSTSPLPPLLLPPLLLLLPIIPR